MRKDDNKRKALLDKFYLKMIGLNFDIFGFYRISCFVVSSWKYIFSLFYFCACFQYYFASTVWECYCHCKKIEARRSVQTDNQPGLMLYIGDMETAVRLFQNYKYHFSLYFYISLFRSFRSLEFTFYSLRLFIYLSYKQTNVVWQTETKLGDILSGKLNFWLSAE